MKAAKASTTQVDGVTGATFSCKAVKENVKRGAKYYLKNKQNVTLSKIHKSLSLFTNST